jgi:hypothetical protein
MSDNENEEKKSTIEEWIQETVGEMDEDTNIIVLDGLDDAIIGFGEEFGGKVRLVYDGEKLLKILQDRDGMTEEEALEWYGFNIIGAHFGDTNPVFIFRKAPESTQNEETLQ